MSEKKMGQAERLFEAMSGVDPELLARSEKKKNVISFQKYAKAMKVMAACLALIVVGGTCWATLQNGGSQKSADSMATINALPDSGKRVSNSGKADVAEAAQATADAETRAEEAAYDNEAANYYQVDGYPMEGASESEALSDDKTQLSKDVQSESVTASLQEGYLLKISDQVDVSELNAKYYGKTLMISEQGKRSKQSVTKSLSTMIYSWLDGLELMPAEDQTFEDYVCVQLIDVEGNAVKEIRVSGVYLQKTDLDGTYEIVDEEYNYDELRRALEAVLQAEE